MTSIEHDVALQNVLAIMELERKKIASIQTKGYSIIAGGITLAILGSILGFPIPSVLCGLAAVIYSIVILYRVSDALSIYKAAYKKDVIGTALTFLDQSLTIEPNNGILEQEFVDSQLFITTPDRYKTEDLIKGFTGKTDFYFAEVHAEYKTKV